MRFLNELCYTNVLQNAFKIHMVSLFAQTPWFLQILAKHLKLYSLGDTVYLPKGVLVGKDTLVATLHSLTFGFVSKLMNKDCDHVVTRRNKKKPISHASTFYVTLCKVRKSSHEMKVRLTITRFEVFRMRLKT